MFWMQRIFPLSTSDSVLQKTPFGFDASVWEFYAPLMAGGRLIMAKPGGHQDSVYLINTLQLEGITTLQLVPSMLPMLLNEKKFADCKSLKRLFCGGEVLSQDLQQRFFDCLPTAQMCNLYGPTEATIDVTFWECRHGEGQNSIPIGRPIDNVQIYIVDKEMRPVPVAVPGELLVGGTGVGTGYVNSSDLTEKRFVPHPFSDEPGQRAYRTGDLACYRPDGVIEFLGRIDHQVKLRGFRIELDEIEAVLRRHPQVKAAVVVVREDTPGDERLVAYTVAPKPAKAPNGKELRDFLKKKLPNFMLPGAFVALDALPLMSNGKVDRRALPMPDDSQRHDKEAYVAPQTHTEKALANIWAEILKFDKVGIYDDFFDLGGHSLLAMQVASRIRNTFNVTFSLRRLFEVSTLAGMALEIEQNQTEKGKHDELAILLGDIEDLQEEEAEQMLIKKIKTDNDGP
jgi:acyl-coenzyme A synthetase/AMP-(fatty) acid ligase